MKQPKINDLKIDIKGTQEIRSKVAKAKKIKITINLDEDILLQVKEKAGNDGVLYQTFINRLLRESLSKHLNEMERIDAIEQEIALIKSKIGLAPTG